MSALSKITYEPQDTFLHGMHPLAKIVLYLFIVMLASIWWDPVYLTITLIFTLLLWWKAKLPEFTHKIAITLNSLLAIGHLYTHPAWLFTTDPRYFRVLPESLIIQVMLIFPSKDFPLGYLTITYGSLIYLYSSLIRIFIPIITLFTALYTINPSDVVQLLTKLRIPTPLIFIFIAMFRFFPLFGQMLNNIINAQMLRGWSLKTRNPVKVVREASPLMYPLGRNFVATIDQVTFSVSNRGFETSTVLEPLRVFKAKWWELLIMYLLIPLLALLWYLTSIPPYIGSI